MTTIAEPQVPAAASLNHQPVPAAKPQKQAINPAISLASGAVAGAVEATITVQFPARFLLHISNPSLVSL